MISRGISAIMLETRTFLENSLPTINKEFIAEKKRLKINDLF